MQAFAALVDAQEKERHPLRAFPKTHIVLVNPLVPVVTGKQPLYAHVERAADIRMALGLKRER